jgi:hypothetical protein
MESSLKSIAAYGIIIVTIVVLYQRARYVRRRFAISFYKHEKWRFLHEIKSPPALWYFDLIVISNISKPVRIFVTLSLFVIAALVVATMMDTIGKTT